MISRPILLILVLAAATAGMPPARAIENGQSPYLKGYRDFQSGVLPPPGVQMRNDITFYSGKETARIPQGQLGVNLRARGAILGMTVVTPHRIFGGNYAFGIRFAGMTAEADRTLTTPFATTTRGGNLTGLNDIVVNPFTVGWHAGNWHWNVAAAVWIPSGNYSATATVNTGRNFWSWSPQFAVTYFEPQSGWEVSAAFVYLFNFENSETRYRSGDVLHIDFALGKRIAPNLTLGLVGYVVEQTKGDSGAGATLGERKAEVAGIGPGARFIVKAGETPVALVAKYFREFSARNTTQGNAASLSMRVHF